MSVGYITVNILVIFIGALCYVISLFMQVGLFKEIYSISIDNTTSGRALELFIKVNLTIAILGVNGILIALSIFYLRSLG